MTSITGVNASDKAYVLKIYLIVFDFNILFLKYLVMGLHYEICSVHLCSCFFITRVWQFNLSDMFMFNTLIWQIINHIGRQDMPIYVPSLTRWRAIWSPFLNLLFVIQSSILFPLKNLHKLYDILFFNSNNFLGSLICASVTGTFARRLAQEFPKWQVSWWIYFLFYVIYIFLFVYNSCFVYTLYI